MRLNVKDFLSPALLLSVLITPVLSCRQNGGMPKARGFYRIELPAKKYRKYSSSCPFTFDYPVYAQMVMDSSSDAEPCWMNMEFKDFQGKLHMSYKPVSGPPMLRKLAEDAREFAYKHSIKATDIEELPISDPSRHVYGIYYKIEGNAASSLQFYLTDSSRNYLRGALYFSVEPRIDSLRPVLDFVAQDMDHMIGTFRWTR